MRMVMLNPRKATLYAFLDSRFLHDMKWGDNTESIPMSMVHCVGPKNFSRQNPFFTFINLPLIIAAIYMHISKF